MIPPTSTPTSPSPACRIISSICGTSVIWAPLEEAESQPARVFVGDRSHHGFERLPQAGVDYVKPLITQPARHDLDTAIVAVESDLGEEDTGRGRHGHR